MKHSSVISIVPTLPPSVNGLGDFAWLLAEEFKNSFNLDTVFFALDLEHNSSGKFTVEQMEGKSGSLNNLLKKHEAQDVLVHYVGYAYSSLGIPGWLAKGLKLYKANNPHCRIVTIFHELYSSGMPWQKAFWTQPLQKKVVFDLLNLSSHAVCNTTVTYSILNLKHPGKVVFIPVFSNVGEPSVTLSFLERDNVLTIFGSKALRRRVYQRKNELELWIKNLRIGKIIDIGPVTEEMKQNRLSVPIDYKGILTAENISTILSRTRYGALNYPARLLTKSGVFAAYAAHGLTPILLGDQNIPIENSVSGFDFLPASSRADHETIGQNNYSWYKDHSASETSRKIFKLFKNHKK